MKQLLAQIGVTDDRAVTLAKSDGLSDWYAIEWAEHPNKHWMERASSDFWPEAIYHHLCYSGRIGDCCIEGTAAEMLAIAEAIERGKDASFKRCAVWPVPGGFSLCSPRNSQQDAQITDAQAKHLAAEIRRVVGEGT